MSADADPSYWVLLVCQVLILVANLFRDSKALPWGWGQPAYGQSRNITRLFSCFA